MADLTDQQAAQTVKITGSNTSGAEDNYLGVDSNQAAKITIRDPSSGTGVTSTNIGGKQALDVNAILSNASDLIAGNLFCTSINASAASANVDNPILLLRNPLSNTKSIVVKSIVVGIDVVNVLAEFKVFGDANLNTTATNISNIAQTALSTTVTVTTTTANGATLGATVTIAGTTNFNGSYSVASVISGTQFTFTKTAPLVNLSESTGTATITTSLGTSNPVRSRKVMDSPPTSNVLASYLPTVSSNGNQLADMAQGQNSRVVSIVEDSQLYIAPGHNILVTAAPASNNRAITVTIVWSETT